MCFLPCRINYILWQDTLRDLSLLRIDLTKKYLLDGSQRVFEFGDKNGRMLAWLARGQQGVTHIGCPRGQDGRLLTLQADISGRFLGFYQALYSSRVCYSTSELLRYLDRVPLPSLDSAKSGKIEDEDISLEEVQEALGKPRDQIGFPLNYIPPIRNCWCPDLLHY